MQLSVKQEETLQVVSEDRCPFCGSADLINRGLGYATVDMLVNWKYQCANLTCKEQFYIQKDLSRY